MNEKIFEKWTEESAYVFGFWLADGHITIWNPKSRPNYYRKKFCIRNTDGQIMEVLSRIIGKTLTKTIPQNPKHKDVYALDIYSDKLFDFCYKTTGCMKKSHGGWMFPKIGEMQHHLVRGFFDGDGSIHIKTYTNRHGKPTSALQTSFTASKDSETLNNLKVILRAAMPVLSDKKIVGKVASKLMFNQYDSMLLCQWMYNKATIFMDRKRKIWDETDKGKLLESKNFFSKELKKRKFGPVA